MLTTGNKVTTYSLILKPAGDLTFGIPAGPQTYSISAQTVYAELPVYNYVDGTGYRTSKVTLVNRASGERIVPSVVLTGRTGLVDQTPRTDGAMVLTLYLNGSEIYYTPGDYSVELTKPNGRTATLTQPVQLLKGPTSARFDATYTLRLNSGEYLLYGSDFYRTDKVSVRIQGLDQQAVTVDALGFIDNPPGTSVGIRLPTALNLKPGYYYAQLLVNGVATASTGRITISDQAKPLIISSLAALGQSTLVNLIGVAYPFTTPVVLTKDVAYNIATNYTLLTPNDPQATRRVRLTLLTDKTQVYDVPFGQVEYTSGDVLKLPATLPTGRYQLLVQLVHSDGTVIDGIPFERDVIVQ